MTKNKTKKTILVSLVAMLVCVAMLTGVTYALFQKSVTSGSNVISTSKYDVSIKYADAYDAADGNWTVFADDSVLFNETNLTPQSDMVVKYIKFTNNNSYDVDASLAITAITESGLAGYLDVYVSNSVGSSAMTTANGTSKGKLNAITLNNDLLASGTTVTVPAKSGNTPGTLIVAIGFKVSTDLTGDNALTAQFNLKVILAQHQA